MNTKKVETLIVLGVLIVAFTIFLCLNYVSYLKNNGPEIARTKGDCVKTVDTVKYGNKSEVEAKYFIELNNDKNLIYKATYTYNNISGTIDIENLGDVCNNVVVPTEVSLNYADYNGEALPVINLYSKMQGKIVYFTFINNELKELTQEEVELNSLNYSGNDFKLGDRKFSFVTQNNELIVIYNTRVKSTMGYNLDMQTDKFIRFVHENEIDYFYTADEDIYFMVKKVDEEGEKNTLENGNEVTEVSYYKPGGMILEVSVHYTKNSINKDKYVSRIYSYLDTINAI